MQNPKLGRSSVFWWNFLTVFAILLGNSETGKDARNGIASERGVSQWALIIILVWFDGKSTHKPTQYISSIRRRPTFGLFLVRSVEKKPQAAYILVLLGFLMLGEKVETSGPQIPKSVIPHHFHGIWARMGGGGSLTWI